jgi:rhodanese-related sulfurtransferase
MRTRVFLGLTMIVVVLSIGLASTSGCSIIQTQETPITQSTSETTVTQTTTETTVTQPITETMVTQTTTETTVTQPTTETTVSTTITTTDDAIGNQGSLTESQQALLADIRSKAEQPYPGIYYIDAVTAKKLLDETQAIFLDARYLVDYDVSHIADAVSLPVSSVWKEDIEPENIIPDKEAVYIAYCAPGCPAGFELARELSIRGYHNLFVLSGGYLAWEDAGYPMDKQESKP